MFKELDKNGFQIIEELYNPHELEQIISTLENTKLNQKFGVREILLKIPSLKKKILNKKLLKIIRSISPNCGTIIKSLYFNKPPNSNWVVNWHQDLTINVNRKIDANSFINWRTNKTRTIVQPPQEFLEKIFTIRIHLDDCNKENGALRVIEGSHKKGVIQIKEWSRQKEFQEKICEVKKGGILIMKPLLLHSSRRTENNKNRRVIHLEFSDQKLPKGLDWKEKVVFKTKNQFKKSYS